MAKTYYLVCLNKSKILRMWGISMLGVCLNLNLQEKKLKLSRSLRVG